MAELVDMTIHDPLLIQLLKVKIIELEEENERLKLQRTGECSEEQCLLRALKVNEERMKRLGM